MRLFARAKSASTCAPPNPMATYNSIVKQLGSVQSAIVKLKQFYHYKLTRKMSADTESQRAVLRVSLLTHLEQMSPLRAECDREYSLERASLAALRMQFERELQAPKEGQPLLLTPLLTNVDEAMRLLDDEVTEYTLLMDQAIAEARSFIERDGELPDWIVAKKESSVPAPCPPPPHREGPIGKVQARGRT